MKKLTRILSLLLIAAMIFSFAACSPNDDTPDDGGDQTENGGNNDNNDNNNDNNNDDNSNEKTELTEVKVGVLKGATGIGAVKLMKDSEDKLTEGKYVIDLYETADVAKLNSDILNGTLDIAALPINAGAALYNKSNGKVQIIAANALGVLSILGPDALGSVADLKGKTLHTTGQAATPQYILEFLLEKNGLTTEDVNIVYYPDGNAAAAGALKDGGYAMLPEPAATAATVKNPTLMIQLNITEEWDKVSDTKLIQGCLVVNTEFAKTHKAEVDKFLEEYSKTVKYVQENTEEAAKLVVKYGIIAAEAMAKLSLPRCGITCITGDDMKKDVSAMLNVLFTANPSSIGGALPDDAYYYGAK